MTRINDKEFIRHVKEMHALIQDIGLSPCLKTVI